MRTILSIADGSGKATANVGEDNTLSMSIVGRLGQRKGSHHTFLLSMPPDCILSAPSAEALQLLYYYHIMPRVMPPTTLLSHHAKSHATYYIISAT